MWTVPGRVPVTPSGWDETYKGGSGKWEGDDRGVAARAEEALALIGNPKSVLDLGSGPLMAKALSHVPRVVAIDFSKEALAIAKKLNPKLETVHSDVLKFLQECREKFELTLAMGIVDYLPPGSLYSLLSRCPSNELLINAAVCEGYVHQYEARVCVYSRKDIVQATAEAGWWRVRGYDQREHEFALYRRLR